MTPWLLMLALVFAETEPPRLDPQTIYVAGGLLSLAGIYFFVVKGINETRAMIARRVAPEQVPVSAPIPNPVYVATQPVFATVEVVDRVDKLLNGKVDKLDKYVHESIHNQARAIEAVSVLVKDGDESHQEAIGEVNRQGEARITKVHDRLNEMDRTIGGLSANTQSANTTLVEVQRTLNILLSRTAPSSRRGGGSPE